MYTFILKHLRPIVAGGILTLGLAIVYVRLGFIFTDSGNLPTLFFLALNAIGFGLCWLLLSFLVDKYSIYTILGIVGLLVMATIAEHNLHISHNPITIPLIILFWLGVAYLILPQFFKKYKIVILSVYTLVISYYFFSFATTPNYGPEDRWNFAGFIVLPIPAFAVLWGYEQWRWLKTLKTDKTKAELALLKSQVNPHFFFNTLNNLYGLVVEKSPRAPDLVLKLSDMMRYTIYEGKEDYVSLIREVNYLETYIELHKIRYRKKVDIQFSHNVDQPIQVAPMLFIILLENAIKHGVEPMTESAYVHMDLQVRGNYILFNITNNYEPQVSRQGAGIGLDNLKKRLAHSYPNRHELKIEKKGATYSARLNLLSDPYPKQ